MVGSSLITPRDGYPLYFAIGTAMLWLTRAEPAHALNLASAIEGAVACGLIVLAAAELSGSIAPALGVALLFAASYTFWSQAIIAEVYSLHMAFVAGTLPLLLRWENSHGWPIVPVLRRVRARVRQPPLDDPVAARLHDFSSVGGAARLAVDVRPTHHRDGGGLRRGRSASVRVEPSNALAPAGPAARHR
jgi:hypothetical protein